MCMVECLYQTIKSEKETNEWMRENWEEKEWKAEGNE